MEEKRQGEKQCYWRTVPAVILQDSCNYLLLRLLIPGPTSNGWAKTAQSASSAPPQHTHAQLRQRHRAGKEENKPHISRASSAIRPCCSHVERRAAVHTRMRRAACCCQSGEKKKKGRGGRRRKETRKSIGTSQHHALVRLEGRKGKHELAEHTTDAQTKHAKQDARHWGEHTTTWHRGRP